MKTLAKLFERLAFIGMGVDFSPFAHGKPFLTGFRFRIHCIALGLAWTAKGGPYDDRSFMARMVAGKWYFLRAFTSHKIATKWGH